jgi:pullulanase/glycogen debranching enzyme
MRHLRALADAGMTDVHLLPVFDIATSRSRLRDARRSRTRARQQASRPPWPPWPAATASTGATTRSTSTRPKAATPAMPTDGAVRIREFRAMVQALHAAGLRVGMDVVYNHTTASGPGRVGARPHRARLLPPPGRAAARWSVSTCCDNTATEHRMMARLMIDSARRGRATTASIRSAST